MKLLSSAGFEHLPMTSQCSCRYTGHTNLSMVISQRKLLLHLRLVGHLGSCLLEHKTPTLGLLPLHRIVGRKLAQSVYLLHLLLVVLALHLSMEPVQEPLSQWRLTQMLRSVRKMLRLVSLLVAAPKNEQRAVEQTLRERKVGWRVLPRRNVQLVMLSRFSFLSALKELPLRSRIAFQVQHPALPGFFGLRLSLRLFCGPARMEMEQKRHVLMPWPWQEPLQSNHLLLLEIDSNAQLPGLQWR